MKSTFFDKVLGRIDRLHSEGLQTVVQRLARERSFLETLFNTIEDGILVVDKNGRIVYFNSAVITLLGISAENSEGQHVSRFMPQMDWEKLMAHDEGGGKGAIRHEFEVQYPQHRFLRLYVAPLDGETAGSAGLALILHDATEIRLKTFETIESERVQALTLLAASVAHEIGNPLNALNIHLQLMEREVKKLKQKSWGKAALTGAAAKMRGKNLKETGEQNEIAGKLENFLLVAKGEIARLDYIVTQFLQAIRPSQTRMQLSSLNEVVQETIELVHPELENRGLSVEITLARQLPLASLDAAQMKQVLVNLIKNAMQAMTKGGELKLQTGAAGGGVWVSVSDTGGGIPQEKINRIFEPFYTTKEKGTGLGLMIVQRIVREHAGRIEVQSRVGSGTSFRIWVPLHEPHPRLLEVHAHD